MKSWFRRRAAEAPMPARRAYDLWSATYGDGTNALQDLEHGAMVEVLPEVEGRAVLDAGCGTGRWSLELRRRGAEVTGFDFSVGMLASSPRSSGSPEATVRRFAAGLDRPLPLRAESFDVAVCALVLGHLPNLTPALPELARVLRPGGHLVISGFHPYATLQGWQRSFDVEKGGRRSSRHIEQYVHLFSKYVRRLGQGGLVLEALEEALWQESPVVFALRARKAP